MQPLTSIISGVAFALLLQLQQSEGQIIESGSCPTKNAPALSTNPFDDCHWYEILRYPSSLENTLQCVQHSSTAPNMLQMVGRQPNSGRQVTISGAVTLMNSTDFSRWNLIFSEPGSELAFLQYPFPENLQVLGVQYKNWIVVWSCTTHGTFHLKFSWVLTYDKIPSNATMNAAMAVLDQYGLSLSDYEIVTQSFC